MKQIKPSELIRLAIHDLEVVETMPDKYEVDMLAWHLWKDNKCAVCFAGAFMAVSLHTPQRKSVFPNDFPPEQAKYLTALNYFRSGLVFMGLDTMGLESKAFENVNRHWPLPGYHSSPDKYKQRLREMADYLEINGL